jgi:hypothetical protein
VNDDGGADMESQAQMERQHRQGMDHDSMRMGPGMNHPGAPTQDPSPPPANQGGSMNHM